MQEGREQSRPSFFIASHWRSQTMILPPTPVSWWQLPEYYAHTTKGRNYYGLLLSVRIIQVIATSSQVWG